MIAPLNAPARALVSCSDDDGQLDIAESVWISFACAVLPPLVAEQKAAFGTYSSPNAIKQVADEAGAYATAMMRVWADEWSADE